MNKYMSCKVSIAPINSSETARIIYYNRLISTEDIPENKRKTVRWLEAFEELGLNWDTGEITGDNESIYYNIGYECSIEYDRRFNTGILKYSLPNGCKNDLMLRRENYFMIIEYEEVFPSLNDLMNLPVNELLEYLSYVRTKLNT